MAYPDDKSMTKMGKNVPVISWNYTLAMVFRLHRNDQHASSGERFEQLELGYTLF